MTILDTIRERVANAIRPRKNINPNNRSRSDRNIGAVSSGNELSVSMKGTVFACLQHRANALSNLDFKSYRQKDYSLEEQSQSHWTNELLKNPNPYFTRSQVFSYIENWLSINGNSFIWTPTNGYRVPLQMWVLNPTRVRVIKGSDNFIDGYIYQSAQEGNIAIPEKEMIHLARIHPASRPEEIVGMNIFGVGLVTAALEYANIDGEVSEYLARLFKNNTVPPLIAKYPDRYDDDEWQRLKARWNEELPDYKLRALLAGGLQLELPPKGELSIGYDSVSQDTRSQIAQVFGVPPGMLTGEYQNRATAEVQWAIFRQNTIDPEAKYIAEEFTRHFKRWEDDVLINVDEFQYDDPLLEMQREEFELKWGIKTINEARADRGYDRISTGDSPMIAGGFVPLDSIVFTRSNVEQKQLASFSDHVIQSLDQEYVTADIKDIFWRKFDLLTEDNAIAIQSIVDQAMMTLQEQVFEKIDLNLTDLSDIQMTDEQYAEIQATISESCDVIKQQLAIELGVDVEDSIAISEYVDRISLESAEKIRDSIDNVAKSEIVDVVRRNSTLPPDELRQLLLNKFQYLTTSRASTIARTTSANVTSGVQFTTYRENGFKMMWLSQRDSKVRPSHRKLDGTFPNSSGMFIVDGEQTNRPLGSGLKASSAINCRCQLFPVKE